jgi:hypothetical protein
VLKWIDEDGSATAGKTFCDAGCGVGSLAIPLAQRGAKVRASDISQAMADEGGRRAAAMELKGEVTFETADLESLQGKYDTVTCIDVLIHYPTEKMDAMVGHLCDVAEDRFIISFAPYTWFYQVCPPPPPARSRPAARRDAARARQSSVSVISMVCVTVSPTIAGAQDDRLVRAGPVQGDARLPPRGGGRGGGAREARLQGTPRSCRACAVGGVLE